METEDRTSHQDNTGTNSLPRPWWRRFGNWRAPHFWILVGLASYTLAGFLGLPWLLQSMLSSRFSDIGRSAQVADIRFNPYTLELEVDELEIADRDGQPLLGFAALRINLQSSSVWRWALTFREITLQGLVVEEERFSGLDTRMTRLLADLAAAEEPSPDAEQAEALPRLIIARLAIDDASLGLTDQQAGGFSTRFGPVSALIEDLRTLPDHSGQQAVQVNTRSGGTIRWQGSLQVVPFSSVGSLEVTGDALGDATRYAEHYLPFRVLTDSVNVSLNYTLEVDAAGARLAVDDLQAQVEGMHLVPAGQDDAVIASRIIALTDGSLRWPEQQFNAARLLVDGLSVDVVLRADGSIDLLDLLPELPEQPASDSEPWLLELGALDLAAATVAVTDQGTSPPVALALNDITLGVQKLDNRDHARMPLQMSMELGSGGQLAFSGAVSALPDLVAEGALTLEDLQVQVAQPYIRQFANITLGSGAVSLQAELQHSPGQLLALAGSLDLDAFELRNLDQDERLGGWSELHLDRFEADLEARQLRTSVVEFEQLYARLHIAEDLSTNLSGLLVEPALAAPETGATDATSSQPFDITIGGISMNDTALDFSDFSLPLPFAAAIRSMNGEISTLATDTSTPANVSLEGQVNEFGMARINGAINAWDPTAMTDIRMVFRNLEISRLSPYTIQFAGYAIEQGRLDLDLEYKLDQRLLKGENKVIVRDIVLGEKVDHPDAGSLPLGLAVALLTNSEGVIDVELPVQGDLDDPQFKIGGVILRALGNLITKVVTAPFRFLGSLVGVDSEDFGRIEFQPGKADVSPPDREKLVKLKQAMLQRPELVLEVSGVYAQNEDRQALKRAAIDDQLEAWLTENPGSGEELSLDGERRALEALFRQSFPDQPLDNIAAAHSTEGADGEPGQLDQPAYADALRSRLIEAHPVQLADLEALAAQRAQAVLEALQEAQDPAPLRFSLGPIREVDSEDDGSVPLELSVAAGEEVSAAGTANGGAGGR